MEQADVPTGAHAVEKAHQRARTLGKFEAIKNFVGGVGRVATHQMANVQLRHFVVGQVRRVDLAPRQLAQQMLGLLPIANFDADEQMRDLRIGIAIVEFGDIAVAEQRAKRAKAAQLLGNRDGEDRLALLAQLRALGDEAQPIEIHVGAARDGDVVAVARPVAFDPRLDPGDRQRARGFED